MTQEEKAKKYDEVVCKLRRFMEQGIDPLITRADVQDFFPELKESKDEKVRKEIINYFAKGKEYLSLCSIGKDDILAWLENIPYTIDHEKREGFHLGYKAGLEKQGEKQQYDIDVLEKHITKDSISELAHTVIVRNGWEIVDAKEQKPADKVEHKFKVGDEIKTVNEEPLSITKIDEKGYWSEDLFICGFDEECCWDLVEQKPAWSIKEKLMLNDIIETTERSNIFKENYQRELIDWLKSLKNRVLPQPKQECSEEDESIALGIEQLCNCASLLNIAPDKIDKIRTWLKSLKQRIGG